MIPPVILSVDEKDKQCLNFLEESILDTLSKTISELNTQAIAAYTPMVEDICTRKNVSKNELESLLDWLVSACISEDMIALFKRVCRHFYNQYPQLIVDYILFYRESDKSCQRQYSG